MIWHVYLGYPPIETSCEKHNHPVDDKDIKSGSSSFRFGWYRFFAVRRYFFADVKSERSRYKKHRCFYQLF